MTPEQIEQGLAACEGGKTVIISPGFAREVRDLALKGLQAEAMREAIRRAVEKIEKYQRVRSYSLPLDEIRADLERYSNE